MPNNEICNAFDDWHVDAFRQTSSGAFAVTYFAMTARRATEVSRKTTVDEGQTAGSAVAIGKPFFSLLWADIATVEHTKGASAPGAGTGIAEARTA